jgi:uncharacterized protein YecE (DUF72 family)
MSSESNQIDIRIGTSGWSYDDWVGPFYPQELRQKKSEWLPYYGKQFETVEINSTFYRIPNEKMVNRWINVGSTLGVFEFSLKTPQAVTHEALVEARDDDAHKIAADFEKNVMEPLERHNLLGCNLIQHSPYFQRYNKKNDSDNLDRLERFFQSINHSEFMYVAEFRHRSWLNAERDDLIPEALRLLDKYNIGICILDGPGFPPTKTETSSHSYFRFHGRNTDIWFKGKKTKEEEKVKGISGKKTDERFNRYDYLYSEDELRTWVPIVKKKVEGKKSKNRLYFNNHPHGQAVQNAFMMMDLVGLPRKISDVKLNKQFKLDSF